MGFNLSLEEGSFLIKLARESIEKILKSGEKIKVEYSNEKMKILCGVFVTLNKKVDSDHRLRGCIGFPFPVKPLGEAVIDAATSAALKDPRFNPVSLDEMESILIEVSVLTPPESIRVAEPFEYLDHIEIGEHGLIVSRGLNQGLLLPQVPVEWNWDSEEFLTHCCIKAGLSPDAWLLPETKISRFRAIVFSEKTPRGTIRRVKLKEC